MTNSEPLTFLQVVAGVAAGLTIFRTGRAAMVSTWRATVGRGLHAKRKLAKLAPTYHVDYFRSVLGAHATRRTAGNLTQWIWVDDLFFVQAITDQDETVQRWAVTSRRNRFRPRFVAAPASNTEVPVRLNRTRFAEFQAGLHGIHGVLGAHRWWYWEELYFGNPGNYLTFFVGINDAAEARLRDVASMSTALQDREGNEQIGAMAADGGQVLDQPVLKEFRKASSPNTYGESAPFWQGDDDHFGLGPDEDQVRVLVRLGRWKRWRLRRGVRRWSKPASRAVNANARAT